MAINAYLLLQGPTVPSKTTFKFIKSLFRSAPNSNHTITASVYRRVQGASNQTLPLFGKHVGHEEVSIRGDGAVQTILLTGEVHLKTSETLTHRPPGISCVRPSAHFTLLLTICPIHLFLNWFLFHSFSSSQYQYIYSKQVFMPSIPFW